MKLMAGEDYRMAKSHRVYLVQCEMRIGDARTLERGDDPVELGYIGHRSDADAIHSAPREHVIAHEDFAQVVAAQFLCQALRIRGVGECAGLYE